VLCLKVLLKRLLKFTENFPFYLAAKEPNNIFKEKKLVIMIPRSISATQFSRLNEPIVIGISDAKNVKRVQLI
jgi:hypothetical protein